MATRSVFWGAFWVLVGLALVFHVVGGWLYSSKLIDDGFVPDPEPIAVPSGDYALEPVTYETELGPMDAWYLPADGSTWVVHVHGKGTTPAEAEPMFAPLQAAGYPQLAITYRNDDGQPADPSGYYQYGATEWADVAAAVDYALANGADSVVVNGYSTGGGIAMSFIMRQSLDTVKGLHLDSPNLDFAETVAYNASQEELPFLPFNVPPTLTAVARFLTSLRIGVNWQALDYITQAETTLRVPILIHHGTEDLRVPVSESIQLAESMPELVTLIQVPGAGHVGSFEADPDYAQEVLAFLQELS